MLIAKCQFPADGMCARAIARSRLLASSVVGLALFSLAMLAAAQPPQAANSGSREEARHQPKEAVAAAAPIARPQAPETSAGASATSMSAGELSAELSSAKDNSLVIANRVISGPLKIDANQRAIMPITFKVEFRDCEFTDDVIVRRVDFGQSLKFIRVKFDQRLLLDRINVKGDLLFDHVESVRPMQVFQAQVDGEVRIRVPAAKTIQVEGLTA